MHVCHYLRGFWGGLGFRVFDYAFRKSLFVRKTLLLVNVYHELMHLLTRSVPQSPNEESLSTCIANLLTSLLVRMLAMSLGPCGRKLSKWWSWRALRPISVAGGTLMPVLLPHRQRTTTRLHMHAGKAALLPVGCAAPAEIGHLTVVKSQAGPSCLATDYFIIKSRPPARPHPSPRHSLVSTSPSPPASQLSCPTAKRPAPAMASESTCPRRCRRRLRHCLRAARHRRQRRRRW